MVIDEKFKVIIVNHIREVLDYVLIDKEHQNSNKDITYNQIIQLIHSVRDKNNPLHYRSVDVPPSFINRIIQLSSIPCRFVSIL